MIPQVNEVDRQARLHSTDVSAILGLNPKRTGHTVWLEKNGRLEPWDGNDATKMGNWLEPSILNIAESELGPLNRNVVCYAENADCPIAATLDAQLTTAPTVVEAKSSGIVGPIFGEWGDEGSDVIPAVYLVQNSVQMLCAEAELVHTYALLGGRGIVRYRINRDESVIAAITEQCERWWDRHIVKGIEPALTEPVPMEIVKRLRRQPSKTISLYPEDLATVAEFEAARELKLSAEKSHAAAQSKLIMLLGDAEAGTLPDGRTITYLQSTRRGYTVDETTFRTLRIKKGN